MHAAACPLPHGENVFGGHNCMLECRNMCRCYGTMSDKGRDGKASLADPASADHDHRLGNALTNLQLGHWDEAATALASLNRFYCEVYQQANQSPQLQGTPPDHVLGKAQLIIEEWIGCMKQLNRCEA